eukprot:759067-Hanusia_phi.AAC.7
MKSWNERWRSRRASADFFRQALAMIASCETEAVQWKRENDELQVKQKSRGSLHPLTSCDQRKCAAAGIGGVPVHLQGQAGERELENVKSFRSLRRSLIVRNAGRGE